MANRIASHQRCRATTNRITPDPYVVEIDYERDGATYIFLWNAGEEDVAHNAVNLHARARWCGFGWNDAAKVHDTIRQSTP